MAAIVEEKDQISIDPHISAAIQDRRARSSKPFVSIEFFPPKTPEGVKSLYEVLEKLNEFEPLYADVTWGAGGSTSDLTLELCKGIKSRGTLTNMHLTCTNMEVSKIDAALEGCKAEGITNLLALRGDPPAGQAAWTASDANLTCALDLVNYIRRKYPDNYFCIGVAGYPEGHPTKMVALSDPAELAALSPTERARSSVETDETGNKTGVTWVCRDADFSEELAYLKRKVDAGASFIVTQMFFCADVFSTFVAACREVGILVPVLPGIMSISNYGGFRRMTKFCKTRVPDDLERQMESLKDDEAGVKKFGVQFGVDLCRTLVEQGVPGLHFYTLNTSTVTKAIVEGIRETLDVPQLAAVSTA